VLGEVTPGPQHVRGAFEHEARIAKRRERHPPHPVLVRLGDLARGLQREPRLPRSARAGERDQANVVLGEERGHIREVVLPAEEERRRHRQVGLVERLQRRKLTAAQLIEVLRSGEILEPVLAEIAEIAVDQLAGRLRQQDLAAVPGGGDPGRPVDVDPDVALVGDRRLAGVQADPHADRTVLERRLRLPRGGDRLPRRGKGDEERVPLRVDLDPAVAAERVAQDPAMLRQRAGIGAAELGEQPRRASTSVKRNVTVPLGSSAMPGGSRLRRRSGSRQDRLGPVRSGHVRGPVPLTGPFRPGAGAGDPASHHPATRLGAGLFAPDMAVSAMSRGLSPGHGRLGHVEPYSGRMKDPQLSR
jgi:hypothetical protein